MHRNITRLILPFLLAFFLTAVHASESKSPEGGGSYTKLEPFTVNLVGLERYLQVQITAKTASPETGEAIKMYMPAIRHALILLLSSKSADEITPLAGKQKLMEEAKIAINKAAGLKPEHGVAAVLFESLVIQ